MNPTPFSRLYNFVTTLLFRCSLTASFLFLSLSLSHDGDCVSILGHSCLQLRETVLVALTPSPQSASI